MLVVSCKDQSHASMKTMLYIESVSEVLHDNDAPRKKPDCSQQCLHVRKKHVAPAVMSCVGGTWPEGTCKQEG